MPLAGHAAKVKISTTSGGTYTEIDGLDQSSLQWLNEIIDATDLKDGKERTKVYGPQDQRGTLSGKSEHGDTSGWVILRDAAYNQTNVFIQFLHDGTAGRRSEFLVSDFNEDFSVPDAVTFSATVERTGATVSV